MVGVQSSTACVDLYKRSCTEAFILKTVAFIVSKRGMLRSNLGEHYYLSVAAVLECSSRMQWSKYIQTTAM